MERDYLCPACCCSNCDDGGFCADVVESEEDVVKQNETIVTRDYLCPACCCSDCYGGC